MSQLHTPNESASSGWLEIVQKQVSSIRFGVILITVHDGKVVQIEKTEKTRISQQDTSLRSPSPHGDEANSRAHRVLQPIGRT